MLLERADRAERRLLLLASNHTPYALPKAYSPEGGWSLDGSRDGVLCSRFQESMGNRVRTWKVFGRLDEAAVLTVFVLQRSYSVSASCGLEEQRYGQNHSRYQNTITSTQWVGS